MPQSLSQTSKEFRIMFLLSFTKELIRHQKVGEITKLENLIRKKTLPKKKDDLRALEKEYGELIPSILYREPPIPRRVIPQAPLQVTFAPIFQQQKQTAVPQKQTQIIPGSRMPQKIPDVKLPPQLQNIKPAPTDTQIDLGKLNSLIQNQEVSVIECNGPDEPLVIKGQRGSRTVNMTLSKEEISSIIQRFSEATKIPAHEGVFKVAFGRLIISAIISDVIGSKFIIKKMQQAQQGFVGYGYGR